MDENNEGVDRSSVQRICELLLSLDLSFALVSVIDLDAHQVLSPFFRLEFLINRLLRIPQRDLVRGYIGLAASSIMLALSFWLALHFSADSKITKALLRFWAGPITLSVPAAFWIYMFERAGWPFGWPYRWAPFELLLALSCAYLYAIGTLRLQPWLSVSLLAAHFAYWFWMPGGSYFTSNYSGPIAPILGFASVLAWALYVHRLPRFKLAHS